MTNFEMRIRSYSLAVPTLLCTMGLGACGGTSSGTQAGPPHPIPTIQALSPNSSKLGGPGFTLSMVGTHFVAGATVHWNGTSLKPKTRSANLMTVEIPASALSTAGPDVITVVNPGPGGGPSNAMNFNVPCVIDPPAPASAQTKARVGAFYFDGWSGPLTGFHFQGLPLGPYQDRQPLSGWQDSSTCAMEQQLAWAHNFGINFFIFDWYFNAEIINPGENLNSALQITHTLPDRHGMQFAIMYVNGSPFNVGPADWAATVNEWAGYMTDPAYVRVNGKPLFVVLNIGEMRTVFPTSAEVQGALAQLRAAAIAQGLPGVYVVGDFGMPDGVLGEDAESVTDGFDIAGTDGYDATTIWGYPFVPTPVNGVVPYSGLSDAGHWTWDQATLHSPIPYVPAAMDGWDPRPWDEASSSGVLTWYSRTPQDVATLVSDAIDWANANPQLRPEPSPTPPIVLITSWNEFGEGNHILPTAGEGTSFGDALATMLQSH